MVHSNSLYETVEHTQHIALRSYSVGTFYILGPFIQFHFLGVIRHPDMDNAESSSRYPTGHGVGHPQEVSRGRGLPRRTSLPDPSPRASPYVAADNRRTRMARNRNRGLEQKEE
uniref:Uncharacterized protein n=1 Tax=Triticum urartu TaxID=4572 RepID=A0A8R7PEI4_TRIUA